MLRLFSLALSCVVLFAPGSPGAVLVTDDFSTYGADLTTGATTDVDTYQWSITNHVTGSNSIPITSSGAQLAGRFPNHVHPRNWTAEADLIFEPSARPVASGAEFTFSIIERHEFTELDVIAAGRAQPGTFIFSGTGLARIEFTEVGINEYLNGSLQATRTYASLGWQPTDRLSSINFTGLHHDNGSMDRSYIDNISVSGVPEPGVLSLAPIGALLILRRVRGRN